MSISRKIFLYSLGIVSIIALFILLYFTWMLSPLYAREMEQQRIATLKDFQLAQLTMNDDNIDQALLAFDTPNSILSVQLAKHHHRITVHSFYSNFEIDLIDRDFQQWYDETIALVEQSEDLSEAEMEENMKVLGKQLEHLIEVNGVKPRIPDHLIEFRERGESRDFTNIYTAFDQKKIYRNGENRFIVAVKGGDKTNLYTSYLGLAATDDHYFFLLGTALTPKLTALDAVIMQSLPMLLTTLIIVILLATIFFTKVLVRPIQEISRKMNLMKDGTYNLHTSTTKSDRRLDEYEQLEMELIALYRELHRQKSYLEEQNNRQKTFLAASSHQLKTPITASILLIDGMIEQIGKYKDSKRYLPEVKEKLLDMQFITNQLLLIHQQTSGSLELQTISVATIMNRLLVRHRTLIEEKQLDIQLRIANDPVIRTDILYLEKVLDNLLANAIHYTPAYEHIMITITEQQLTIENTGVQIDPAYLEKIFEPFVRPAQTRSGHGLGLYIVAQYAAILSMQIEITNTNNNSVIATLSLHMKE